MYGCVNITFEWDMVQRLKNIEVCLVLKFIAKRWKNIFKERFMEHQYIYECILYIQAKVMLITKKLPNANRQNFFF